MPVTHCETSEGRLLGKYSLINSTVGPLFFLPFVNQCFVIFYVYKEDNRQRSCQRISTCSFSTGSSTLFLITMPQWFCSLQEAICSSEVPLLSINHYILANCPLRLLAVYDTLPDAICQLLLRHQWLSLTEASTFRALSFQVLWV